ncbi:hypothetical protein H8D83_00570 [Candidatus Woesearchaeota archaeon]|nr:hypothetical protein [Candidatus Woesearchaeota archaeon]MBL7050824.1 hypothetical protein [Candidatus Woesearchaeota archaeon]
MKSKKAMIFNISLVVITIVVLTTAFIAINNKIEKTKNQEKIGTKQYKLITTYQELEKVQFYLEQSMKYATPRIIERIKDQGNNICRPSYEENVAEILENELKTWITRYPDKNINFLLSDIYEISIIDNGQTLIASAKKDTTIQMPTGNYSIKPSFSAKFNHQTLNCTVPQPITSQTPLPNTPRCYNLDFSISQTTVKYQYSRTDNCWKRNGHKGFGLWTGWDCINIDNSGWFANYAQKHILIANELQNKDERQGMYYLQDYYSTQTVSCN